MKCLNESRKNFMKESWEESINQLIKRVPIPDDIPERILGGLLVRILKVFLKESQEKYPEKTREVSMKEYRKGCRGKH